ncbi:MAG: hypothetical protein STSR0001_19950 [Methanothrix sp.]|jgi:hypothetical protein
MKLIERINVACLMAAMICVIITSISCLSAASDDYTDLMKLITDSEDVRIDAQDLAFLLATHGFDAVPKGDRVVVKLDDVVYKMTPNGVEPGLADILIEDLKPQVKAPPSAPELHNG